MSNSKTETRQSKASWLKELSCFIWSIDSICGKRLSPENHWDWSQISSTKPSFHRVWSRNEKDCLTFRSTEINSRVFSSFFYYCVYFVHIHKVLQENDTEVERLDISLYVCCNAPCVSIAVQWPQMLTDKSRWFSVVTTKHAVTSSQPAMLNCIWRFISTLCGILQINEWSIREVFAI